MPERRSPRKLRDVSHLFLSESSKTPRERERSTVSIWLAAFGGSLNRAHFAAGTAAAFAHHGMCVSLLEVCSGLPNIGYYFSMEPAVYLAPVLRRRELVSGAWDGAVRFCFSANPGAFERYEGDELPPAVPHAIITAFTYPHEREAARYLAALQRAAAVLSDDESGAARAPDAIIVAGCMEGARRARSLTAGLRDAFPHAAVFLVMDDRRDGRADEADELVAIPADLRASWARRVPPADRVFGEIAGGLLQIVSQKRRRRAGHAANG
ncbi:MAG: hypothetical protein PHD74_09070 [Candidatus Krumholzibacteria bacterium]|nr:hypothetical protein [Candidatus Krumholzibacteria bacterium]